MDIVYAAERLSIANLLSEHTRRPIRPEEIDVTEDPGETGSFRIDWRFRRFLMMPNGQIVPDGHSPPKARRAPRRSR